VVEGCRPIERETPLRLAYGQPPPLTGEEGLERPIQDGAYTFARPSNLPSFDAQDLSCEMFMEAATLVELLRHVVTDDAARDAIAQAEKPSGRNQSDDQKKRAAWISALSAGERAHLEYVASHAVHATAFGLLCVLDGARKIEDGIDHGHLELRYVKGQSSTLLASSADHMPVPPLHELL